MLNPNAPLPEGLLGTSPCAKSWVKPTIYSHHSHLVKDLLTSWLARQGNTWTIEWLPFQRKMGTSAQYLFCSLHKIKFTWVLLKWESWSTMLSDSALPKGWPRSWPEFLFFRMESLQVGWLWKKVLIKMNYSREGRGRIWQRKRRGKGRNVR